MIDNVKRIDSLYTYPKKDSEKKKKGDKNPKKEESKSKKTPKETIIEKEKNSIIDIRI